MRLTALASKATVNIPNSTPVVFGRDSVADNGLVNLPSGQALAKPSLGIPSSEAGVSRAQCTVRPEAGKDNAGHPRWVIETLSTARNPVGVRTANGELSHLGPGQSRALSHHDVLEFDLWRARSDRQYKFRIDLPALQPAVASSAAAASPSSPTPPATPTKGGPSSSSSSKGCAFSVGDIVDVRPRTGIGQNKPGGVARVTKVREGCSPPLPVATTPWRHLRRFCPHCYPQSPFCCTGILPPWP